MQNLFWQMEISVQFRSYLRGMETMVFGGGGFNRPMKIPILPTRHGNPVPEFRPEVPFYRIPILPTRHGNRNWGMVLTEDSIFLSYLRGMETGIASAYQLIVSSFLSYLRGMETDSGQLCGDSCERIPILPTRHGNKIQQEKETSNLTIPILPTRHGNSFNTFRESSG